MAIIQSDLKQSCSPVMVELFPLSESSSKWKEIWPAENDARLSEFSIRLRLGFMK